MNKEWKEFAVSSRTRDPKPRSSGSWWLEADRDGFTALAAGLFVDEPVMAGVGYRAEKRADV
jgi:hypothetical protein